MWISEENENCQGQKDCQSQTQTGTQETVSLRLRLPKSARIRKRFEYMRLSKFGRRVHAKTVSFDYKIDGAQAPRLGITVSKKYGNACRRNRFKRVVREAFRHLAPFLPLGMEINVHPKTGCHELSKNILINDFNLILNAESRTKTSS